MSALLLEFERAEIDPDRFDHEAHVRVAWLLLEACSLLEGISRYSSALRRITKKFGIPRKYHETITWFFMIMIAERRTAFPGADWLQFKAQNPDLVNDAGNLIARYYSSDCLQSEAARKSFVLPDAVNII